MGASASCCCKDRQDDGANNSDDGNCVSSIFTKYAAIFGLNQTQQGLPSNNQGQETVSLTSNDNRQSATTNPPTVLPLNPSNNTNNNSVVVIAKPENNANVPLNLHKEPEQLRTRHNDDIITVVPVSVLNSKMKKLSLDQVPESEYENCPICFYEYTDDNPRIITQCKHDYHLSCIYEWMERSAVCPICSKVMIFDEAK